MLNYFELDESAIEAEAIRRSAADIELLDKLLASLESRRDKALRREKWKFSLIHVHKLSC